MHINHIEYTILLADTSLSDFEKMRNLLVGENFKLLAVHELDEVCLLAEREMPDVIILHVSREEEDGVAFIRQLKQHPLTRRIPILYLTSVTSFEDFKRASHYEGVEFLARPLSEGELILRIDNQLLLLDSRRIIEQQSERLQHLIKTKDKLYSVITHDLRAPIGTLKMMVEAIDIQKDSILDDKVKHMFKMLQETTNETYELLENLLSWSGSQSGVQESYMQSFSFENAVREVIVLQGYIAAVKEIKVCNHVEQHYLVYADVNMVKAVLRNLLSNAIKFSYEGSEIHICAEEKEDYLIVSVKDCGMGISLENQCELLESGLHFISYGTRKEKGNGFGLQLCKDLVKINQGKFWFESQEGMGSTFYFSIPMAHNQEVVSLVLS